MQYHAYFDEESEIVRLYAGAQPDPAPGLLIGTIDYDGELPTSTAKTWLTVRLNQLGIELEGPLDIRYDFI